MPSTFKRFARRSMGLIMALLLLIGTITQALIARPAQAAYKQAYIQTTVDSSTWDILAGVITVQTTLFNAEALESQRMGSALLDKLAESEYPSAVASNVHSSKSGAGNLAAANKNLVMVFPGDSHQDSIFRVSSTDSDLSRATLVRNSLIYDLNTAFKFVYGQNYVPSGASIDDKINQYANDMETFLKKISGSDGELTIKGTTYQFKFGYGDPGLRAMPDTVTTKNDYVYICKRGNEKGGQYFLFRMPKGYVDINGTSVSGKLGLPSVSSGNDAKYIHWGDFAVEAFVNFKSSEKLQVSSDDVYTSTPNALEKAFAGLLGTLCDAITSLLGLWSFDELIFNSGIRGTTSYVGGIFPSSWQEYIWAFFFFFELTSFAILLYAIIYNVSKRAMATVNPIVRANAIDQIQYLFVVAVALGLLPLVIQLFINLSANLTGIFTDALGTKTASERFKSLASKGGLGQAITYLIYLGSLVYFNIFYQIRALIIAILIMTGPLFLSLMAVNENQRRLTVAWAKELFVNIFIQPIQALLFAFMLLIPPTGRNIDSIVLAYAMIPLTHMIRGMIFGDSGSLVHQLSDRGKQRAMREAGGVARTAGGAVLSAGRGAVEGGISVFRNKTHKDMETDSQSGNGTSSTSSDVQSSSIDQSRPTPGSSTVTFSGNVGAAASTNTTGGERGHLSDGAERLTPGTVSPMSELGKQITDLNMADESNNGADLKTDTVPSAETEDSVSSGFSGLGKGAALTAGAILAGAAGGAMDHFSRRVFGIGGSGVVTQLSGKLGQAANRSLHFERAGGAQAIADRMADSSPIPGNSTGSSPAEEPAGAEPIMSPPFTNRYFTPDRLAQVENDSTSNVYDSGHASREDFADQSVYRLGQADAHAAGMHVHPTSAHSSTISYDLSAMGEGDATRAGAMLSMWQNGSPQERAVMEASGIQDVRGEYRTVGGEQQLTKVNMDINPASYASNYGVDVNAQVDGKHGVSISTPIGHTPQMVPDVSQYMAGGQQQFNPEIYTAASHSVMQTAVEAAGGTIHTTGGDSPVQEIYIPNSKVNSFVQTCPQVSTCTMEPSTMPNAPDIPAVKMIVDSSNQETFNAACADKSYIPQSSVSSAIQSSRHMFAQNTPMSNNKSVTEQPVRVPNKTTDQVPSKNTSLGNTQ